MSLRLERGGVRFGKVLRISIIMIAVMRFPIALVIVAGAVLIVLMIVPRLVRVIGDGLIPDPSPGTGKAIDLLIGGAFPCMPTADDIPTLHTEMNSGLRARPFEKEAGDFLAGAEIVWGHRESGLGRSAVHQSEGEQRGEARCPREESRVMKCRVSRVLVD